MYKIDLAIKIIDIHPSHQQNQKFYFALLNKKYKLHELDLDK